MRLLYTILVVLALPFAFIYLGLRGLKDRRWWQHVGERLGAGPAVGEAPVMVHAASVGEVQAAAPLIAALRDRLGEARVLASTVTPTGRERLQALPGVVGAYLPLDLPWAVDRRLDAVRPRLLVVVETEIWPGLFAACHRRGIPVVMVNARLSETAARRYRRLAWLTAAGLDAVTLCLAQSEADAERFREIGIPASRVRRSGNLKFDRAVAERTVEAPEGRRVWVAGSVRAEEEGMVLDAWQASASRPLLVLAPRHPERFDALARELDDRGLAYVRRSRGEQPGPDTRVWLLDTLGELGALYSNADLAFVGGSLVPVGGHNLLEPAAAGVPVISGPYLDNTRAEADALRDAGGLMIVDDAEGLAAAVDRLLHDDGLRKRMGDAARSVVAENRGALQRTLEALEPWMGEE